MIRKQALLITLFVPMLLISSAAAPSPTAFCSAASESARSAAR